MFFCFFIPAIPPRAHPTLWHNTKTTTVMRQEAKATAYSTTPWSTNHHCPCVETGRPAPPTHQPLNIGKVQGVSDVVYA